MKYLLTIFNIVAFFSVYGQTGTGIVNFIDNNDSIYYQYHLSTITNIGLKSLDTSPFPKHYRIRSNHQYVELWYDSFWRGKIASYAYELVNTKKENSTSRHYSIFNMLDSTQLKALVALLDSKTFENIPSKYTTDTTRKYICLHSPENIVEIFDGNYYFRNYEFCSGNANAVAISKLIDNILMISNAEQQHESLREQVPFESFTFNGYINAVKVSTRKQKRGYLKERNKYRQSVGINNKPERERD